MTIAIRCVEHPWRLACVVAGGWLGSVVASSLRRGSHASRGGHAQSRLLVPGGLFFLVPPGGVADAAARRGLPLAENPRPRNP